MTAPGRLTERRVRLLRQVAQLLHRPRNTSAANIVRHVVGIPAQDRSAAPLAIRARTPHLVAADVDAALSDERSVVWTWAMRGTLHLISAEDHGWLVPLVAAGPLRGSSRRLDQEGLSADQAERALRKVERMLADHGPMTRVEIAEELARGGIRAEGQALPHLIRIGALRGLFCHGSPRSGKPVVVLVRDWLGSTPRTEPERALAELARRYLVSHGPASPEDLAAWSGLRVAEARTAWKQVAGRLVEMKFGSRSLWTLGGTSLDAPTGILRLLPAFDPYLLGWKGRGLVLPEEHERKVFPGGGILRPTLIVDGMARGTWATTRAAKRLEVKLRPFSRLSSSLLSRVTAEADDVGRFVEEPARLSID